MKSVGLNILDFDLVCIGWMECLGKGMEVSFESMVRTLLMADFDLDCIGWMECMGEGTEVSFEPMVCTLLIGMCEGSES